MQDKIEREIIIKATKQKVYEAIADPQQIIAWFPDAIEGSLDKGERPILNFGEHGKNQIYIEATEPYTYFAFRWIPGSSNFEGDVLTKPNTLVEFRVEESEGISTLTLTESGFASLPSEVAEASFKQNSGGWEFMIGRLVKHFKEQ
jgi:uncharacterized protein YndB with AHSA1/START domain